MKTETDVKAGFENFVLPPLYYPFPSAVNPHAEAAEQHSLEWGLRFQIITPATQSHFRASQIGWFTASLFPKASREALLAASDWNTWFCLQDDLTDESSLGWELASLTALDARFIEVLEGQPTTAADGPLTHALADGRCAPNMGCRSGLQSSAPQRCTMMRCALF